VGGGQLSGAGVGALRFPRLVAAEEVS